MPSWKEILEQLAMIQAAPVPFVVVTIAIFGIIWLVLNWSYSSVFASKNAQIELLDRQVSDWKQKTEGATPDQAKARIDALEARVGRIEPRRLSAEQREIIRAQVTPARGIAFAISITSELSCTDCGQYAADFQQILTEAGWTTTMPRVLGAAAASPKGVSIITPDPNAPVPEAASLIRALTAAKIPFDLKAGLQPRSPIGGPSAPIAALLITAKSTI